MLLNISKLGCGKYLALLGSNVFGVEKHVIRQFPMITKSIMGVDPVVIPCRGMRGVRSQVLHKEVIDKHRLKKLSDEGDKLLSVGGMTGLTPNLTQLRSDDEDMPVADLENPYTKPASKCLLCEHDIELDYKNTRLLSQFVSPHTGRIYGRNVTGLCLFMQRRVGKLIKRSQYFGFMPYELKDPRYMKDPKLFDPFKRK